MQTHFHKGLVWFRRDLRVPDNAALTYALAHCDIVYCVFIFDTDILGHLPKYDRRVEFIHASVSELAICLKDLSAQPNQVLAALHTDAVTGISLLADTLEVDAVFAARDYEPDATRRDQQVQQALRAAGRQLVLLKDHVVYEEREVLTQTGKPYTVFTPYYKAWLARCISSPPHEHAFDPQAAGRLRPLPSTTHAPIPSLQTLGFEKTNIHALKIYGGASGAHQVLEDFIPRMHRYDQTRNFPGLKGPSYLGVHLRFGTISIRKLVNLALEQMRAASAGASVWLAELAWRDFYFQIIANFPRAAYASFKPEFEGIAWEDDEDAQSNFLAWCDGRTGYPLVDAAMAQLNQTGYMHNRLRMVAGSFLVKHLGINWQWGEKYFARQLNDFDLSANNGGWQWVASSGCDAQPYFRIFNPVTQSEKFDPEGKFIRKYIPQISGLSNKNIHAPWLAKPGELIESGIRIGHNYPAPLVEHVRAREKTLLRYGAVKKNLTT